MVFVNYKILSSSNDSLKDNFTVKYNHHNENIYLKIDLSHIDPIMVNSNVSGVLSISNMAKDN